MSDAAVLRDLLEDVVVSTPTFPATFYEKLFARHPEVKPLFFRSSPDAQQKMFLQKLMMLVDALDDAPRLRVELRGVAHSHQKYGVTKEMYAFVGEALVEALNASVQGGLSEQQRRTLAEAWGTMTAIIFQES